ncbi:hypothetical protein T08_11235 [Trichinella sp. T8]|nr:hypothetical protein T08_11235 [Trichinella sp. T8]
MWFYDTILQYITIGAVHCFLSGFEPTVAFTRHINYLLS